MLALTFAKTKNTAFSGSPSKKPLWYLHFYLTQIKMLRGGKPIVHFNAADNCRLYDTIMGANNFQGVIPLIPIGKIKDHYGLLYIFDSRLGALENCHYKQPVLKPLKLELTFTFLLEHVTDLTVLREQLSSVVFDKVTKLVL